MNTVIYLLNTIVQQLAVSFYFYQIGKPKYKYPIVFLGMCSAILIEYGISYCFFPNAPMFPQYISKIGINFFVFYFLFDGRLLHKIIQHLSFYLIAIIVEGLMYGFVLFVFSAVKYTEYNIVNDSYIIAAGRIMTADLLLAVLVGVAEIVNIRLRKDKADKAVIKDLFFIIVLMLGHFGYLLIYYKLNKNDRTNMNNLIQLAYQVLFLVLVFIQYYTALRSRELMRAEQQFRIVRAEMDNNYRYYQLAESKFDEISKLRHDLNNQLGTVRQLLVNGNDIERAESIIDSISENLAKVRPSVYCADKALNAVLSVKYNELKAKDIELHFSFEGCDEFSSDTHELCTLFSDMLDICAEDCAAFEAEDTQQLYLNCIGSEDGFRLSITSPCGHAEGELSEGKSRILQRSVEQICRKYGGSFSRQKKDDRMISFAEIKVRNDLSV